MKLRVTAFLLCFLSLTAYPVDISTDPVYVNLTAEEAAELLAARKAGILSELKQVGLFTDEALAPIADIGLAPGTADISAALASAIKELDALHSSIWATLDGTYATVSRSKEAQGAGMYLAGDYGSKLSDKPCAWLLTHDSQTRFTLTSTQGVTHSVVIEQADSRFPECVMLSMPNGITCLGSYGTTATYISIDPTNPNCVWHLARTTKPEPSALTDVETDGPGGERSCYDMAGRRLKRPAPGLNIIGGRKVWVRQ